MSEKREKPYWEGKHYSFFQNTECEYFPCHRIADPARFSCLFCYCPLYMLGPRCGGNFRYTEKGIKDCTDCLIPHLPENYGRITGKYKEIAAAMRQAVPSQTDGNDRQQNTFEKREDCRAIPADKKEDHPQNAFPRPDYCQGLHGRKTNRRIVMLACTERGFETMRRAASALEKQLPDTEILQTGRCAYVPGFEDGPGLSEAAAKWFHEADALIFIAAAGIAVRCIAPFVQDKFRDPAVLVMDENGKYIISLMSGHVGGANRLCGLLAESMGAEPVITTATDGRGLFAVDVFAAENGLQISDRTKARKISARILAGETPRIFFDGEFETPAGSWNIFEKYGKGISRTEKRADADIIVSFRHEEGDFGEALYLIPQTVTLGIGCRKGITEDAVQKAVLQILRTSGVFRQAVSGIASIDLKREEAGLHAFAEEWNLPLTFYTSEELSRVPGTFSSSAFVRNVTGVDCVCERSAVRLAMECKERACKLAGETRSRTSPHTAALSGDMVRECGKHALLLEKKHSLDGVTVALAIPCPQDASPV